MAARTPTVENAPARRPRADAVRNRARIVETAREVFAVRGADASLEEIARGAGVGIGTLYRHFPTRDDLVETVFHDRIDELEALAEELLTSATPGEALATWLHAQLDQAATCRGLAAEAMLAMLAHTDAPSPCESMRQAGAALLARAQAAGEVREGVDIDDLVRMVQAVTLAAEESDDPGTAERLFGFVLEGVRAR
ncbi:MAG TPA: helix-turn-helix domain-containing protein [Acidimicrobiia bacterium]|nr:helix-turn-helix domain-containing protein [Acidimicrobiia bacterium]